MSKDSDFSTELPSDEQLHEGRKSALFIGLVVGGIVVAVGVIAYLVFGKFLPF